MSFFKKDKISISKAATIGLATAGVGIGGYLLYKSFERKRKQKEIESWFPRWGGSNRALIKYHSGFIEELQDYDLKFLFTDQQKYYGHVTIKFTTRRGNEDVFLNSMDLAINKLTVNGKEIPVKEIEGLKKPFFLTIPANQVRKGENEVSIAFEGHYGAGERGLPQFLDKDGNKYLTFRTNLWSNYGIFPCFEQSNFRGKFRLRVVAPEEWIVSTSTKGESTKTGVEARNDDPELKQLGATEAAFEKTKF